MTFLDSAAIEYVLRNIPQGKGYALAPRFVLCVGHKTHLKLEAEDVELGDAHLPRGIDGLVHLRLRHWRVDRADQDERGGLAAVEGR